MFKPPAGRGLVPEKALAWVCDGRGTPLDPDSLRSERIGGTACATRRGLRLLLRTPIELDVEPIGELLLATPPKVFRWPFLALSRFVHPRRTIAPVQLTRGPAIHFGAAGQQHQGSGSAHQHEQVRVLAPPF